LRACVLQDVFKTVSRGRKQADFGPEKTLPPRYLLGYGAWGDS